MKSLLAQSRAACELRSPSEQHGQLEEQTSPSAGSLDTPDQNDSRRPQSLFGDSCITVASSETAESDAPAPAGAPTGRGVLSSNTPPLNSNERDFRGGEDWFEWSVYVDWSNVWATLQKNLEFAKDGAQQGKLGQTLGWDLFNIGPHSAQSSPSGCMLGKKGKGMHMPYLIYVGGLVLQLRRRAIPTLNGAPNVMIRADGTQCLQRGAVGCLDLGRSIIWQMGGQILGEKLTRVDMCLDLADVPMDEFIKAYNQNRYICRAKDRAYIESSGVTIYIGKSPLRLRIYDKKAELDFHRDTTKRFAWLFNRWGGKVVDCATRVEFELGREALKSRGINSLEDYFEKRGDLIAYLCEEWVRFTADSVNRSNTSRVPVLPLWKEVAAGFKAWAGQPKGHALAPLPREKVDVSQLHKQAVGVMLTAAATTGHRFTAVSDFLRYVETEFAKVSDGLNLDNEFDRRQAHIG